MHEAEQAQKKVYLSPEDFAERITPEQLYAVLAHQEAAFKNGRLIKEPLPPTEDDKLLETFRDFAENREIYDEHPEIENALDSDAILKDLQPNSPHHDTKPEQSRAIRIRASVVAAQYVLQSSTKLELVTSQPESPIQSEVA